MNLEKILNVDEQEFNILIEKINEKYTVNLQLILANEELAELIQAISKNLKNDILLINDKNNEENLIEEFVDVIIKLKQISYIFEFDTKKELINKIVNIKLERMKNLIN